VGLPQPTYFMSRLTAIVPLLTVVCLSAQQAPAPPRADPGQAPMTFKVAVNYVEIDATVTDAQGNPVTDLTVEDFQLAEDQKPQTVTVFSHVALPVERPDPLLSRVTAIEPDVRTNRREFDGRVFVLMLDDLHTNSSRSGRLRAAASAFIQRHMSANDVAAVVYTSGSNDRAQEFTGSRSLLLAAVNRFVGQKLPSAATATAEQDMLREMTGAAATGQDPDAMERAHKDRQLLAKLRTLSDYLSGVHGRRKSIVLFSEGIDTDYSAGRVDVGRRTDAVQRSAGADLLQELQSTVGAAGRANVSIYTVDPRGLVALEAFESTMSAQRLDTMTNIFEETRRSQDSLRTLAAETGGIAAVDRNDFTETFDRIIRDNSNYYVLGYYPSNGKRDGRFRKVDVKVRRPGLTVRARTGYVAPKGDPPKKNASTAQASEPLQEALTSPLPVSGLALTAAAVPFRSGVKASVLVVAEIDGSRFAFTEKNGRPWNAVELVTLPIDGQGRPVEGKRDELSITPRPQTRDAIVARGVRLTQRFELAPGRYQLRVGVREAGSGSAGSVPIDLDVPDFTAAPLTMSGIVVSSSTTAGIPSARVDELLKDVLPDMPTVTRDFPRGDELTVYAEIYDQLTTPHKVEITTTATADDGRVMYARSDQQSSSALKSPGDGFGHVATIPLKDVLPGRYVLRIEAHTSTSGPVPAVRELEFRVR
jgi:VWFA-related protein